MALLGGEIRGTLRRRHWRQRRLPQPGLLPALVLVLLLHALFALALWYEMGPKPVQLAAAGDLAQALTVRLIDDSSPPHAAQPPPPPAPPSLRPLRQLSTRGVRPVTREKPLRGAMVVQDQRVTPAGASSAIAPPDVRLFARDGSVRLPPTDATASATASTGVKPARPADDRQIMQHDNNRMHYKATRFEKYFPPPGETAGGAVGRHIGDVIQEIAKSVCDPKKKSTASNLLCGVPPLPPSAKDGDERLNLPPAPLADDPHPAKTLPLSVCIAEYKADKALSYGCPINTPDLAFKAEMRVCIDLFRAGQRLKTWCPRDTAQRAAAEASAPAAAASVGLH